MVRLLLTSIGDGSAADAADTGGADAEDLGADRLARSLRDAGHEVVALGAVPSADWLVATAVQEDVEAVALWLGAGQSPPTAAADAARLVEQVVGALDREGAGDVAVLAVGGSPEVREAVSRLTPAEAGATFAAEGAAEQVIAWLLARP